MVLGFPLVVYLLSIISLSDLGYNSQITSDIISFMNNIFSLDISSWYNNLLGLLSSDLLNMAKGSSIGTILVVYPLYVFYVYLLDLVLDVFVFIPKLLNNFFKKLGGEKH